ncbi:restriction endonuclease subunit S [Roseateles cavernae]|uniref:restriction endonuclease subunit S n=1 Tax=Roseateles cavernae TaxID=3153578 RepID=UPI0032E46C0A
MPKGWEAHRLKWTVTSCENGVWGEDPDGGDDDVVCLRVADFDRTQLTVSTEKLTVRAVDERQRKSRELKKGDLLIEKSGGGEKQLVGCVVLFDHEMKAVTSNFVARMSPAPDQCSRYWTYAHAALYSAKLNYLAIKQTTGIQNLEAAEYLNTLVVYPPLVEQELIAKFLLCKTAQIDTLIAKKQTLIERLREKRLSLITQAVTKGLNPAVPLQPSGVAWLGRVPANWKVVPLGYLVEISGGMTPSMANGAYWDGDVPWVTPKDMKRPRLEDSIDHVTRLALEETGLRLVAPNAVLAVVRGMILAHSFPVAINDKPVTINQDMKALRCGEHLHSDFLFWGLSGFADVLSSLADESAHGTRKMETSTLKRFEFPVPPYDEQVSIARSLRAELAELDSLMDTNELAIERLVEYRSALITSAVTGQIDVRHVKVRGVA